MFLTLEELRELTGYAHRANQTAWLEARAWPFEVSGSGRILVLRDYMAARMSGLDAARPTVHAHGAHRFDAIG
jgi:hypothetical protein